MTKAAFDKIAEGLTEALSIAKGDVEPARLHMPPGRVGAAGFRAERIKQAEVRPAEAEI